MSHSPSGEGTTQMHEYQAGGSQGPPKSAHKGLSTGPDTTDRHSANADSSDGADGEVTMKQKEEKQKAWGPFSSGHLISDPGY